MFRQAKSLKVVLVVIRFVYASSIAARNYKILKSKNNAQTNSLKYRRLVL